MKLQNITRRDFIATTGAVVAAAAAWAPAFSTPVLQTKKRIAIVGTGIRALDMWSVDVVRSYPELIEFVGLCDINPGRLSFFKSKTGFTCPAFTDFNKMMREVKPDT
ncbi:MAG: twin-arginine translocation signal domain-containing protein, partial [Cyclobacteriaceae bacterium]|nr:twin-arginine translocation signal domain-containing protein [Cyclobacteriaceae bacterium]